LPSAKSYKEHTAKIRTSSTFAIAIWRFSQSGFLAPREYTVTRINEPGSLFAARPPKQEFLCSSQLGRRMEEDVISGWHRATVRDGHNRRGLAAKTRKEVQNCWSYL
jgi:hypothetical protein